MEKIITLLDSVGKITKGEQSAESYALMATILKKYPYEEIQKAVMAGLEKWIFFPTIADILELLKPQAKLASNESFDKIIAHIQRFGSSEKIPNLTETETSSLRSIGGLRGLGMSEEKDLKWKRKEFIDAFEMYYNKPDSVKALPSLKNYLKSLVRS